MTTKNIIITLSWNGWSAFCKNEEGEYQAPYMEYRESPVKFNDHSKLCQVRDWCQGIYDDLEKALKGEVPGNAHWAMPEFICADGHLTEVVMYSIYTDKDFEHILWKEGTTKQYVVDRMAEFFREHSVFGVGKGTYERKEA